MNRDEIVVCGICIMIGWMVLHEFTTKQWVGKCTVNKKVRDDISTGMVAITPAENGKAHLVQAQLHL